MSGWTLPVISYAPHLSWLPSRQGSHARVQGRCAPSRASKFPVHGKDRKHHPDYRAQLLAPRYLGRIRAPSFRGLCHRKIPLDSRHSPTTPLQRLFQILKPPPSYRNPHKRTMRSTSITLPKGLYTSNYPQST